MSAWLCEYLGTATPPSPCQPLLRITVSRNWKHRNTNLDIAGDQCDFAVRIHQTTETSASSFSQPPQSAAISSEGSRRGPCINYRLLLGSLPRPEDTGNYSCCQRSHWTPVEEEGGVLLQNLHPSFICPLITLLPFTFQLPLSSLLEVMRCEDER